MSHTDQHRVGLRRREALWVLGGLGVGGVARWSLSHASIAFAQAHAAQASASAAAACTLTPEVTSGPYYVRNHLLRRNITENEPGVPLTLHLQVQHAATCKPIAHADVEIWHANAAGVYSGYGSGRSPGGGRPGGHATPNNKLTFLRGHQTTDAAGQVIFDTIYPGWYPTRAPHIHLKVHVGGSVVHTGQLFFADPTSDAVYRTAPYKAHGQPDTSDATDAFYAQAGGAGARLKLVKRAGKGGYVGAMTLEVAA